MGNSIPDGARKICDWRFLQRNLAEDGCQKHKSAALLGHSIVGAIGFLTRNAVTGTFQHLEEIPEYSVAL